MAWKRLRHGPNEVMDRLYRGEAGVKRTCITANSVWLNEDVSPVFDLIKRAHAIHERLGWHPNPICIGGVDIQYEK